MKLRNSIKKSILIVLGTFFVILGAIGIFVPLIPTVGPLLLAAICYAKSSERLHDRLLSSRVLGKIIKDYRSGKGMHIKSKILSLSILWISLGISFSLTDGWVYDLILWLVGIAVTIHLLMIKTSGMKKYRIYSKWKIGKHLSLIITILIFSGFVSSYETSISPRVQAAQEELNFLRANFGEYKPVVVTDDVFECENKPADSVAYIILLGFGKHDRNSYPDERAMMLDNIKTQDILVYDYDESQLLANISDDFVTEANKFIEKVDVEELIVIGFSAGGIVALESVERFDFNDTIELHTIGSPLKGYGFLDLNQIALLTTQRHDRFGREIGLGFDPWPELPENIKVYHHKDSADSTHLRNIPKRIGGNFCGEDDRLCDPLQIQNNNVPNSEEFYYEGNANSSILLNIAECR